MLPLVRSGWEPHCRWSCKTFPKKLWPPFFGFQSGLIFTITSWSVISKTMWDHIIIVLAVGGRGTSCVWITVLVCAWMLSLCVCCGVYFYLCVVFVAVLVSQVCVHVPSCLCVRMCVRKHGVCTCQCVCLSLALPWVAEWHLWHGFCEKHSSIILPHSMWEKRLNDPKGTGLKTNWVLKSFIYVLSLAVSLRYHEKM